MAPLQDLLNLGAEARMNVPGRADGNWRWRCTEDMLDSRRLSNGCGTLTEKLQPGGVRPRLERRRNSILHDLFLHEANEVA